MKKIKKVICIMCVFCLLFSTTVYAEAASDETVTFVEMSFGSDEKDYITVSSNGIAENNLPAFMPGHLTTVPDSSNISPRSIFGSDGREQVTNYSAFPYTAICYIITKWPNGRTTSGTGWLFNKDSMVTSAHCVYNEDFGGGAVAMKVYPGKNGLNLPFGEIRGTRFVIDGRYELSPTASYDSALVKLNAEIGNECGYFGYTCNGGTIGDTITVTGYPGDKGLDINNDVPYQWTMSGRLNTVTINQLSYLIDTYDGQSGAPVYLANSNIAIGIHHGTAIVANTATRINDFLYQLMVDF